MTLEGNILSVAELNQKIRERMFALMSSSYENIEMNRFNSDLDEKDDVILLEDCQGSLQGFSTLKVYREHLAGKTCSILFSGDTIIAKKHWGSQELPKLWGAYAYSLIEKEKEDCYWFLMSKGYKTFRFLPVFFNEFIPSISEHQDLNLLSIRDAFANNRFGQQYDSQTGIISFGGSRDYLKKGVADLDEARLSDKYVKRFVELNPDWYKGDELACLAPLTYTNFNRMGKRIARAGLDKILVRNCL